MKSLTMLFTSCLSVLISHASPFAPDPSAEIVVYSDEFASSPLHVATSPTNTNTKASRFDFPASYAGHRAVCRIPAAATNDTLLVWSGGDTYAPGDPFAVLTPGENLRTVLHRTSPITPRIDLTSGGNDRNVATEIKTDMSDFNQALQNNFLNDVTNIEEFLSVRLDSTAILADDKKARIRVVRYAIDDLFCYVVGVGSHSNELDQLVVMDAVFNPAGRDYLCEADFLGNGKLDIDWDTLTGTSIDNGAVVNTSGRTLSGGPWEAGLGVTNMTYLVVIGDGAKDVNKYNTNKVHVTKTLVTRRFEKTRHLPVVDANRTLIRSARPTFTWSMPDEEDWAKKFGSSYTAFKIELHVYDASSTNLIWTSGTTRAPAQDYDGRFSWAAPDLSSVTTGYTSMLWRVSMYNAKFRSDAWSDFSVITIPTED